MSTRWMTSEEEKKRVTLPAGTTWDDVEVTRRILRKPAWLPGGALVQPLPKKPRGPRKPPEPRRLDLSASLPFAEVRRQTAEAMAKRGGVLCPCCGQQATIYQRHVTFSMVTVFSLLYRFRVKHGEGTWAHVPTLFREHAIGVAGQGGEWAKGRFWGLCESEIGARRGDGSTRTGYARITDRGVAFLTGNYRILSTAWVYDNVLLKKGGVHMTVSEVKSFDYRSLFGDETPNDKLTFDDEPTFLHPNPALAALVAEAEKNEP